MNIIRFDDKAAKRKSLGHLAGRFSFKSWATGEMMLPKEALALLAEEDIRFTDGQRVPRELIEEDQD